MAKKAPSAKQKAEKAKGDKRRREAKKASAAAAAADPTPADDAPRDIETEPAADPHVADNAPTPRSKLMDLRAWNDRRTAYWRTPSSRAPRLNALACPECGAELVDKDPTTMRPSNPPRFDVNCSADECHWSGVRVG